MEHVHTTVINSGRAHTTQQRTHCGLWLRLQSWLMMQSPQHLRNDLKCVEWDVKPCSIQSYGTRRRIWDRLLLKF